MAPEEFAELLREELARRGGHFEPADMLRFVQSAWDRIAADPDPAGWAEEFLGQGLPDLGA